MGTIKTQQELATCHILKILGGCGVLGEHAILRDRVVLKQNLCQKLSGFVNP